MSERTGNIFAILASDSDGNEECNDDSDVEESEHEREDPVVAAEARERKKVSRVTPISRFAPDQRFPTITMNPSVRWGWQPIHELAVRSDARADQELEAWLKKDPTLADQETQDHFYRRQPAFLVAYYHDRPERLEIFRQIRPDSLFWADLHGRTLLNQAAFYNHPKTIDYLVRVAGATLNQRARNGSTALHVAVLNRSAEAVRALLLKHADTTLRWEGRTPRELAVHYGFYWIAALFDGEEVKPPREYDQRVVRVSPPMELREIRETFARESEVGREVVDVGAGRTECFLMFPDEERAAKACERGAVATARGWHTLRPDFERHSGQGQGAVVHVRQVPMWKVCVKPAWEAGDLSVVFSECGDGDVQYPSPTRKCASSFCYLFFMRKEDAERAAARPRRERTRPNPSTGKLETIRLNVERDDGHNPEWDCVSETRIPLPRRLRDVHPCKIVVSPRAPSLAFLDKFFGGFGKFTPDGRRGGRFWVLRFETDEAATAALEMEGKGYRTAPLKVSRITQQKVYLATDSDLPSGEA
jgi:hypothetical protein